MKLYLPIALFLLTSFFQHAFSQEIKRIQTDSGTRGNKYKWIYYVLKDSPQIKHGSYEYYIQGNLAMKGFYYHGVKDSTWEMFGRNGVVARRVYDKGKKSGVWENRDAQGGLIYAYDFGRGQIIENGAGIKTVVEDFYVQKANGKWGKDDSAMAPIQLFTPYTWQSFLNRNLRYPMEAIDREVQGTVIVAIIFDETGHATDYEIVSNTDPLLNEEALRVIKLFDYEYVPVEKDGKKIKFVIKQPMVFRLERG